MHVLYKCYSEDVKKYGFKNILKPFFHDLQKLESGEGVLINLDGEEFVLRATLRAFFGDGLAVHDVNGLLAPSANRFCRMCLITRVELLNSDVLPKDERTAEVFANDLNRIRNAGVNIRTLETDTGVRSDTALHDSRVFRIYDDKNK